MRRRVAVIKVKFSDLRQALGLPEDVVIRSVAMPREIDRVWDTVSIYLEGPTLPLTWDGQQAMVVERSEIT